MTIDDGGPAFPHQFEDMRGLPRYLCAEGLSIRDWFAGQALPAIIAATSAGHHHPVKPDNVDGLIPAMCRDAYLLADALLAARSKGSA